MKSSTNAPTHKVHDPRVLIRNLTRKDFEWTEDNPPIAGDNSYTAKLPNYSYAISISCECLELYQIKDGKSVKIASSEQPDLIDDLTMLYKHAWTVYETWIGKCIKAGRRRRFRQYITLHELFSAVDVEQVAWDVAEEKTFSSCPNAAENDILAYRYAAYRSARDTVRGILSAKAVPEPDFIPQVDESDPNPGDWRVVLPANLSRVKTDLHTRICPDYFAESEDSELTQKTTAHLTAVIVLLSV